MARSFTNVKFLSALIVDEFSTTISRRGYAAATQGVASKGGNGISSKMAKKAGEDTVGNTEKVSWVPDPKTGNYKPENSNEIDAADLRAMLLTKKN